MEMTFTTWWQSAVLAETREGQVWVGADVPSVRRSWLFPLGYTTVQGDIISGGLLGHLGPHRWMVVFR